MAMSPAEAGRLGHAKSQQTRTAQFEKRIAEYLENPKRCQYCGEGISYKKHKDNKFCNRSCAASFNNKSDVSPKRRKESIVVVRPRGAKKSRRRLYKFICAYAECEKEFFAERNPRCCSLKCDQAYKREEKMVSGTASTQVVRTYLIKKYGKRCLSPTCLWDFDKMPISVDLEHIDGDATNNFPENVTLLCPNCHSLTLTYKGRNKGKGRAWRRQLYADGKKYQALLAQHDGNLPTLLCC